MLVGGGWVIDLALMTCIIAIGIDRPLIWWRNHFPLKLRIWLDKMFPFFSVLYSIVAISMNVLSILGVNDSGLIELITILAAAMIIIMPLFILSGLAQEIQRKEKLDPNDY